MLTSQIHACPSSYSSLFFMAYSNGRHKYTSKKVSVCSRQKGLIGISDFNNVGVVLSHHSNGIGFCHPLHPVDIISDKLPVC